MIRQIHIRVSGDVQGVNYRYSTRLMALELKLTGFVKNEDNGDVYIEAEGPAEQLEKLVAWCRKGPPRAEVDAVVTSDAVATGFEGFEIR